LAKAKLADFLFDYLKKRGVRHCFGIPGDYILPMYKSLEATSGIDAIVGTHEPCSVFSADAYGRMNGLGVILVTFGPGALNIMNGVACAYAESSPLLIVSGAPPSSMLKDQGLYNPQLHHVVKNRESQLKSFEPIVDSCFRIESGETASKILQIAVMRAENKKLPVYLEIPYDLMQATIPIEAVEEKIPLVEEGLLSRAVGLFTDRINKAINPVLLIGVEVGRYKLQEQILRMIRTLELPAVSTPLGKGTIAETLDTHLGVYAGILSPNPEIRKLVEDSDLLIMIGTKITDVNCGAFTANLKKDKMLIANSTYIGDGFIRFSENISLPQFINALVAQVSEFIPNKRSKLPAAGFAFHASQSQMDRYLGVINDFISKETIIVADTGDSCYGSLFLKIKRENGYFAPLFYNTMGFAIPAAIGLQLADPALRPIILVGDGAFQMTGMEVSNMVKHRLNPIIIVFNNDGFGMQRIFQDGEFNTLARWDYTKITNLVGGGKSFKVNNPSELSEVMKEALTIRDEPCIIEVTVERGEISTGLRLFSQAVLREKTGICPMRLNSREMCDHQTTCAFCRAPIWD
jgi:TPP-dependent 2-oxoacid decarboxylase